MLSKIDFPKSRSYRSGSEYEPLKFYLDCLSNAKEFDLLLGYFSSTAINVLSLGFANFIFKGGKMRIIANHILSEKDKEAILTGLDDDIPTPFDLQDIGNIKKSLSEYGLHFFKCLAYLISCKRLEIRFVNQSQKVSPTIKTVCLKMEMNLSHLTAPVILQLLDYCIMLKV
ncbi:phospholipase D-like domain-containing protein [Sphingobacterium populi]|uniref:hypothetical protein n=1 Tax=Sphingobacterium sp. CFCC 11742 TaxID=1775560 RepID=UPI000A79A57D|nr:hypothetical protein [Sphingobacterium sp. CFCC 11742]